MKLTPEDFERIELKKLAAVLRRVHAEKPLSAKDEAILEREKARVLGQAQAAAPVSGFVGTWDELGQRLDVSRRAIQDWRNDPRYKPEIDARWHLLERAGGRKCVAEWLRLMVDLNLKRGAVAATVDVHPDSGEADESGEAVIKPPRVGGNRVQWDLAIAALDHRKKSNALAVAEGSLLVASELEVPLGAMLSTFQMKGAAFPSRVASRLTGLRDAGEIEDRLREELDADFADLQFASYLAEDAVAAAVAAVPFDDATKALCEKLLFDGADRTALLDLAGAIATDALRQLGRRAITAATDGCSKTSDPSNPPTLSSAQASPIAPSASDSASACAAIPPAPAAKVRDRKAASKAKASAVETSKHRKRKPRPQPATATPEVEAAAVAAPRRAKTRRRKA